MYCSCNKSFSTVVLGLELVETTPTGRTVRSDDPVLLQTHAETSQIV